MLPFFILAGLVAALALLEPKQRVSPVLWAFMFLVMWIFVGLRHHVGMDWNNYLGMIQRANRGSFTDALDVAEPGYVLLLRIAGQTGTGVYGAYFMGTAIFMAGLFRFARRTPEPWIALLVATPILVIVVSMSAARQSVAIGVLLWLAADWNRSGFVKRMVFIGIATCFHTSAVAFAILAAVDLRTTPATRLLILALAMAAAYWALESTGKADYYEDLYVKQHDKHARSEGAYYHIALNGLPAIYALLQGKAKRQWLLPDRNLRNMAIIAGALLFAVPFASAAAGRLSLYLFPVSMQVFAALPAATARKTAVGARALVCVAMLGICVVWLLFANSSIAHRNYQNALFLPARDLELCCRR